MSFILYPYDGAGNIPDSVFHWFWHKMEEQGVAETVFYSGHIKDAYAFTLLMKTGVVPMMFIDEETKNPIGMAWLSDIMDNRALGHFAILKEGRDRKIAIGRQTLKYWLNDLGLNNVLGIVPSFNKKAIKYIEDLGLIILGEVPMLVNVGGEYQSAYLGYFSKEELENGR